MNESNKLKKGKVEEDEAKKDTKPGVLYRKDTTKASGMINFFCICIYLNIFKTNYFLSDILLII